jgi:hypothetical protein
MLKHLFPLFLVQKCSNTGTVSTWMGDRLEWYPHSRKNADCSCWPGVVSHREEMIYTFTYSEMRILQLIVSGTLANAGRPERVINKQTNKQVPTTVYYWDNKKSSAQGVPHRAKAFNDAWKMVIMVFFCYCFWLPSPTRGLRKQGHVFRPYTKKAGKQGAKNGSEDIGAIVAPNRKLDHHIGTHDISLQLITSKFTGHTHVGHTKVRKWCKWSANGANATQERKCICARILTAQMH